MMSHLRYSTPNLSTSSIKATNFQDDLSLVVRKPVFGVFDLVPHKLGCTAIEDG